jgi:hypothetical protein
MSDFLASLVDRALAPKSAVRPRLVSLFEPLPVESAAAFPRNDPRAPIIDQPSEGIPGRISQLKRLWGESPEQTVVHAPRLADDSSVERFEAQSSIPARGDEANESGVREESATNQDRARRRKNPKRAMPNENSIGQDTGASGRKPAIGLVNDAESETVRAAGPERRMPRKGSVANEPSVIAFPEKTDTDEPGNVRRQGLQEIPLATATTPAAHPPQNKRSSDASVNDRAELNGTAQRHAREAGKIFPAREIQLVPRRPAVITRIPPLPPREIPAPEPSIHVTIGRVEVRATLPAPARLQPPRAAAPIMTLDQYLRERAGGSRR